MRAHAGGKSGTARGGDAWSAHGVEPVGGGGLVLRPVARDDVLRSLAA